MAEVKNEIESARGPIYLKVSHLPDETLSTLEGILHTTERPTRGTFHANRGHDYRTHDIEMHISEIGLCGGHSASGVWVDENARTTVPGLYAAGDLACVPHNYMIGAFVYGELAGAHAASTLADVAAPRRASGRPDRRGARADLPAAAPPRRPAAAAGRVQAAPLRQRLRRAAEDRRQAVDRGADLRADARRGRRHRRHHAARADARRRGVVHPRLRRDGRPVVADPHRIALGPLPRPQRHPRARRRRLALPPEPAQDRRRRHGVPQAARRAVLRAGSRARRIAQRRNRTHRRSRQPDLVGGQAPASRGVPRRDAVAAQPPSPRIAAVLALDEPTVEDLAPYLADDDPGVRRTAVDVLTEHLCDGYAPALVAALGDADAEVRRVAADGIRELVEVLPDPEAVAAAAGLRRSRRCAAPRCTCSAPAGPATPTQYRRALADRDHRVRIEAVRALVSVDDADGVAAARADANREVRIAVANGLGTLRTGADAVRGADRRPRPAGARRRVGGDGFDRVGRRATRRPSRARSPRRPGRSGRARRGRWPGRRRRRPRCRRCRGRCPIRTSTCARPRC